MQAQDGAAEGGTIVVCGEVAVRAPGASPVPVRGRQPQLVLAHLAVEARPVLRDDLAELLWGDGPLPDHWSGAVRGVLAKVRAVLQEAGLPATTVTTEGGLVSLQLPPGWTTDLARAGAEVADAEAALAQGRPAEAAAGARRAGAVVRAPVLPAAEGDWVRRLEERVTALRTQAAAVEVDALLAADRPAEAAEVAVAQVAADELDEVAQHRLVVALLASGRRGAAQRAYDALVRTLRTELGIAPAAETTALLAAAAAPAPATGAETAGPAPAAQRFVGRHRELDALRSAWKATRAGSTPHLVVVEGQAGIGKTSLAEAFAEEVAAQGAELLWGRCRAVSGLPYEPVAMALRRRLDEGGPRLAARLGPHTAGLAAVVPGLDAVAGRSPEDPELARAEAFRDVTRAIATVAEDPTVWVVDDVQWASADTMALLEVVLDRLDRPVLVVVTARNLPAAVSEALSRLQRLLPTSTLELGGLSEGDLAELVADLPGAGDDGAVASALHRRTGGHPFFVAEIAREAHRAGTLDVDGTPDAVRSWVRHRVGGLDPVLANTLDLAAVVGMEVPLDLLVRCAADAVGPVLDRLEQLAALGFLAEPDDVDLFVFPHQITRDVILDRLGATRRARLHRSVAEALEAEPDHPGRAAALSHHWASAGPASRGRAVRFALEAGGDALARSAWSQAEEHLAAACALAGDDEVLRTRTLVPLAVARHRLRRPEEARALLDEAVELARHHQLAPELADAAAHLVGRGGRGVAVDLPDEAQAELLRDALAGLAAWPRHPDDPTDGTERRELLAITLEGELALALVFTGDSRERSTLVLDALARVRRAPDPDPVHLARALLNARLARSGPEHVDQRLADLDEIGRLPGHRLTPEVRIAALAYRQEDELRLGDRVRSRRSLEAATRLAGRSGPPFWQWALDTWGSLSLAIDGRLDEAEAQLLGSLELHVGAPAEAVACLGVQLVNLRLFQGRAGEVVPLLADAAEASPHIPCYRAVLALCRSESGDRDGAAAIHRAFAADRFTTIPEDSNRFLALAVLGDVAADLDDAEGAAVLHELLVPYAGQHVLLNCYGGGGAYWGPTARILARLAATTGDHEAAARWSADAVEGALAVGAPLAEARARREAEARR